MNQVLVVRGKENVIAHNLNPYYFLRGNLEFDLALQLSWSFSSEEVSIEKVRALLLRKEVIQPQVPLRLPCYDFIPITGHTLGTRGHFGYNRLS